MTPTDRAAFDQNATPTQYNLLRTKTYPCCWKIVADGNWKDNNASTEYFRSVGEAKAEIIKRGATFNKFIFSQ